MGIEAGREFSAVGPDGRRVTTKELEAQVRSIGTQIQATAPDCVGFAVLLFFKGQAGEGPGIYVSNAVSQEEKAALQRQLRRCANAQGGIILLDPVVPGN